MYRNLTVLFLFFLTAQFPAFASRAAVFVAPGDTLLLMNGSKLAGEVLDTTYHKVKVKYVKKSGKERTILIENDLVFSIRYKDGHEKIIYEQDTIAGNYFTADETRFFIFGEQDAEKNYHCPGVVITSFAVGLASGYMGNFLSLIPPFAYSGILLIPKIRIKYKYVSNPVYLNYDTYVLGFEKVARRKKIFRSLVSGIGGLGVGFVAFGVWFTNA
jgi:hypothetical protein